MQAAYKGKNPKPKGFAHATCPPPGVAIPKGPLGRAQGPKQAPARWFAPQVPCPPEGALPPEGVSRPGVRASRPQAQAQAGPQAGSRPQARPQAGSKQAPSRS